MSGAKPYVLVAGAPNAGKTTLFNALTGARARVGNYPGVTVERTARDCKCSDALTVELVDLPGTYSLSARSPEEEVSVSAIFDEKRLPDAVVVVVDATTLSRNLYLAVQIMEAGLPVIIALNMMDVVRRDGVQLDAERLSAELGVPVVPMAAAKREGLDALRAAIVAMTAEARLAPTALVYGDDIEAAVDAVSPTIAAWRPGASERATRAWALWALLSLGDDELTDIPTAVREAAEAANAGGALDEAIIAARYRFIDEVVESVRSAPERAGKSLTDRIDGVLLNGFTGTLVFVVVMFVVFEALFSWSEPFIGIIEAGVEGSKAMLKASMPGGPLRDLLENGVIGGVGNVVVFVPQIALLFLMMGFLEDSGYLARAAFLIDRLMARVGLSGKAFVPLLSGFACAVPAAMATRTIASRRDRLATMLALPLMSCSARLPVYALVIATVFAGSGKIGFVSVGALMLLAMYLVSVAGTLIAAAVLRRTAFDGPRSTLVLELPAYRMPALRPLLRTTWARVRTFLVDAGTIILAMSVILWALLTYPQSDEIEARYAAQREQVMQTMEEGEARAARLTEIEQQEAGEALRHSAAGRLGVAMEPAIEPLGFDWRMGIGLIGAFAAREVFVSTMGTVFGIGEGGDEGLPVRAAMAEARWPDGRRLLTPLSGLSLMLFFVFACQCMSTIAVVKRESGSWKWPALMFTYMTVVAYVVSLVVYQIGAAMGWGVT